MSRTEVSGGGFPRHVFPAWVDLEVGDGNDDAAIRGRVKLRSPDATDRAEPLPLRGL